MAVDSQYTILLIEDNPDHAELMSRCFDELNYSQNIIIVSDGEAALQYLDKCKNSSDKDEFPKPRLILLDLRLPKKDGMEILISIKSDPKLRKIPVVVVSTSDSEKDIEQAYINKANSYLVKPYDYNEIKKVIRDVSRYWLEWNQLPS